MSVDATTVLISVVGSSVVAAVVSGFYASRNERKKQLLESRRTLAGDFAGDAMGALAALRRYKPPDADKPGHPNRTLYEDSRLCRERAQDADDAVEGLRPARGRIWVTFPGRSSKDLDPQTTSDWAEEVVAVLRTVYDICREFWDKSEQDPDSRTGLEQMYEARYRDAKEEAWDAIHEFAKSAAAWLEPRSVTRLRSIRATKPRRRSKAARISSN